MSDNNSRHAYCIIAHNEPALLQRLVSLIDDGRNDIYILYDRKADKRLFESIKSLQSPIVEVEPIDIRWGDLTQVKAELTVMKAAVESGNPYSYLHLISGVDLPLKTQDYIHEYCDSLPLGQILLDVDKDELNLSMMADRTERYHIFTSQYKQPNALKLKFYDRMRSALLRLQSLVGYRRSWRGMTLGKGSNWGSFTLEFASYLVHHKDFILRKFRGVPCADELYKQTMALSSDFRDKIRDNGDHANGREIDWQRGNPYVWRDCDYDELMSSPALFARKFSTNASGGLIERICDSLKSN